MNPLDLHAYGSPDPFHRALTNISNDKHLSSRLSTLPRGWSPSREHETPTGKDFQQPSSRRYAVFNRSTAIRRHLFRSHGDLSALRSTSPPIRPTTVDLRKYLEDGQKSTQKHEGKLAYDAPCADIHTISLDCQKAPNRAAVSKDWRFLRLPKTSQRFKNPEGPIQTTSDSHKYNEKAAITIPIQGLNSSFSRVLDFYVPSTRAHPESLKSHALLSGTEKNIQDIQHLDVSTTWHGLQCADAEELLRIHNVFTGTLERILANELRSIHASLLQGQWLDPQTGKPATNVLRGISFCRDQLSEEMADVLYPSPEHVARAESGLLRLYLAATDCLVQYRGDVERDTSITVHVSCVSGDQVVIKAAWVPDNIRFLEISPDPREGLELRIIPRYYSRSGFGGTRTPANMMYKICSQDAPLSWLSWNPAIAGFAGRVPFYSQNPDPVEESHIENGKLLRIEVKAILLDDNGAAVVFERVVRALVTLNILSQHAAEVSSPLVKGPNLETQTTDFCGSEKPGSRFWNTDLASSHRSLPMCYSDLPMPEISFLDSLYSSNQGSKLTGDENIVSRNVPVVPTRSDTLAERHAQLAAKYAELSYYHSTAQKQQSSLKGFGPASVPPQDFQAYLAGDMKSHQSPTVHKRSAGRSTRSSTAQSPPHNITDYSEEAQNETARSDDLCTVSARTARRTIPSQWFDQQAQAWNRRFTPLGTKTCPEDGYDSQRAQANDEQFPPLQSQDSRHKKQASYPDISEGQSSRVVNHGPSQNTAEKSPAATISCVLSQGEISTKGHSHKRRPDTSPLGASPLKRVRDCAEVRDCDAGYGSLGSADSTKERHLCCVRLDSGEYTDMGAYEDLPTPASSSASSSRVPSNELDISVAMDTDERRKQALLWNMNLSQQDGEGNKAEDIKLSSDEIKAIEKAMERSIDDLVGRFEDSFFDDDGSGSSMAAPTELDEL